jgi:hypothetical protein
MPCLPSRSKVCADAGIFRNRGSANIARGEAVITLARERIGGTGAIRASGWPVIFSRRRITGSSMASVRDLKGAKALLDEPHL